MNCYSCGKNKNELHPKKSEILNGVVIMICQACIDAKFEPRWVIVLGGRQKGSDHVRDYIVKRRYIGNEILANELIA
jgi:protein-arginine kinase activator protein McsA